MAVEESGREVVIRVWHVLATLTLLGLAMWLM